MNKRNVWHAVCNIVGMPDENVDGRGKVEFCDSDVIAELKRLFPNEWVNTQAGSALSDQQEADLRNQILNVLNQFERQQWIFREASFGKKCPESGDGVNRLWRRATSPKILYNPNRLPNEQ